jgi:hypothetical protein
MINGTEEETEAKDRTKGDNRYAEAGDSRLFLLFRNNHWSCK